MTFPQNQVTREQSSVTLVTNQGEISLVLFPDQAPKAVENFIGLAKEGKYDGVIFHRVIPNFMIQGGDPSGSGFGGQSYFGQAFADEFSDQLFNFNGALSMANSGPNTNGSQFFIVTAQAVPDQLIAQMKSLDWPEDLVSTYQEKGGTPWLDHKHTVFGQVVSGMDAVYAIEATPTDSADKPVEDIVIESVRIEDETLLDRFGMDV